MNTAPNGSVIRRDAPRPDLLAFEIRDKITKTDTEWMASVTDEVMKAYGQFDMLIIMSNYEGSDVDARFDGYSASVKARSITHIRRYVVVGAPAFARAMISLSGWVTPVETKTFELAEESEAWTWLAQNSVGRYIKT